MNSRKRNSLIMLIITIVLAIAIVISLVLLILQRTGLESITINPTFADTELDVNMDYTISVNTDPSGTNTKKFDYECDSSAVTFEAKDDGTAILHTTGEGAVTIYVKKGKIQSNSLTFQIVDKAAAAAAEQAAAAAAAAEEEAALAAAEAEAAAAEAEAAAQVKYIKAIKDNVNIRSSASTDGEVLGKAKLGDTFEVINDDGSWTEFKYGDKSGFMRNDMVEVLPDGASATTSDPVESTSVNSDEKKTSTEDSQKQTEAEKAAEDAKKAEDAAKKAEEEAKKAAEEQAAQLAAAQAAAASAVATGELPASGAWSYQGKVFTAKQVAYFHAKWDYTGAAAEMVTHHSAAELQQAWEVDNPGVAP